MHIQVEQSRPLLIGAIEIRGQRSNHMHAWDRKGRKVKMNPIRHRKTRTL